MSQELEKYNEVMTAMSEMKAREESLQAKVFLMSHQPTLTSLPRSRSSVFTIKTSPYN
jgi:hypothetical protein